jgi:uncharacterized protein YbaR (Trm112 family)
VALKNKIYVRKRQVMPKRSRPVPQPSKTGWLEATNQMWKLYFALLGFGVTLVCFLGAGVSLLFWGASFFGPLLGIGTILGGMTFVWLLYVLRCPSCRSKLVWKMISSSSHMSWLVDLANLVACPSCHIALIQRPSARWRAIS